MLCEARLPVLRYVSVVVALLLIPHCELRLRKWTASLAVSGTNSRMYRLR